MTYKDAVKQFRNQFIDLWERQVDYWTAQETWSCWVDGLCKDGQITQRQYDTWRTPFTYGKRLKLTKRFSR